jgi:hypothetical protein
MALPSSGQLSMGNIMREVKSGDGGLGTYEPTATEKNLGMNSLKHLCQLPAGEGNLAGVFKDEINLLTGWYVPNFDEGAEDGESPHTISQWYSASEDGV